MKHLWKLIPMDILIHHILPYCVQPQKKELLSDIRDYQESLNIAKSFLFHQDFNNMSIILLHMIINQPNDDWYNQYYASYYRVNDLLSRTYLSNPDKMKDIINDRFVFGQYALNSKTKINILWGLMTPKERTHFINIRFIP